MVDAKKAVLLRSDARGQARPGHPWIYKSQIQGERGSPKDGDLVRVLTGKRQFLGLGYFNGRSQITVRFLTRREETVDAQFFKAKIRDAAAYRERFVKDTNAYRVVSSEGDGLPGLVVDRYGDVLVVQFLTLGMERLREPLLEALRECIPSRGIYERSDAPSRRLEGLEERTGWIERSCGDEVEVYEREARFMLRFGEGHKTGLYLDQRENRLMIADFAAAHMAAGGRVLDAFCYEGAFGLHLALKGFQVLGVDIQEEAVQRAQAHRALNGVDAERLSFRAGNLFGVLKAMDAAKERFDLIVVDPPSFVRSKDALEGALSGYKEILLRGFRILNPGGLLAVFSCSHHLDDGHLMQVSMSAAWDARRQIRLLKFLKQSMDHPINPFIPETVYLKGFLFTVF